MIQLYPGFCSIKCQGELLLPTGWDTRTLQSTPQQFVAGIPFMHLGEERHSEEN